MRNTLYNSLTVGHDDARIPLLPPFHGAGPQGPDQDHSQPSGNHYVRHSEPWQTHHTSHQYGRGPGRRHEQAAMGDRSTDAGFKSLSRKFLSMGDFKSSIISARALHKKRPLQWLVLNDSGDSRLLLLDKRQVIQMFGLDIPMRDMRLLDNQFISRHHEAVAQISVREQAFLLSMEFVKIVILSDKVIIPMEPEGAIINPAKQKFMTSLQQSVQERAAYLHSNGGATGDGDGDMQSDNETLPFELHVLEVALRQICNHLAREVDLLQARAQPALEDLTRKADTPTLERVRRIKTGHQRIMARVKLAREVLERLIEDDDDMLRMCLTRPPISLGRNTTQGSSSSLGSQRAMSAAMAQMQTVLSPFTNDPAAASAASGLGFRSLGDDGVPALAPALATSAPRVLQTCRRLRNRRFGNSNEAMDDVDVAELERNWLMDVENLLESYFMLLDSTHQRVVSLGEYIDDFEDMLNIQLDYSRNSLIRFDIMLASGTFALAIFNAVAGMLGENLKLPDIITADVWGFAGINIGVLLFCGMVFMAIMKKLSRDKLL